MTNTHLETFKASKELKQVKKLEVTISALLLVDHPTSVVSTFCDPTDGSW